MSCPEGARRHSPPFSGERQRVGELAREWGRGGVLTAHNVLSAPALLSADWEDTDPTPAPPLRSPERGGECLRAPCAPDCAPCAYVHHHSRASVLFRVPPLQLLTTDIRGRARFSSVLIRVPPLQFLATDVHGWAQFSSVLIRVLPLQLLSTEGTVFFRAHPCSSAAVLGTGRTRTYTVMFRAHPCSSAAVLGPVFFRAHPCLEKTILYLFNQKKKIFEKKLIYMQSYEKKVVTLHPISEIAEARW